MKTLYLDCVSGIAGDMALSALVDLGADPAYIERHLRSLPIDPFAMSFQPVVRKGITALWLDLRFEEGGAGDGHGHSHGHSHGDGPVHTHEHSHGSQHEHSHRHDHVHSHEHSHGDGPVHTHEHSHGLQHEHSHGHDHVHSHEHSHWHEHVHNDEHAHGHSHAHGHDHHHEHRKASEIIAMIAGSSLPSRAKSRSIAIFEVIAAAEGKIHGMDPADVHFHEVGAMDSILDIIGVCLALENLDIGNIVVSPVPVGHGRIRIAHGVYPIPAPATAELLIGVPIAEFTARGELTTPTGAGIVKALASGFGPLPGGEIQRIGYGAGTKDFDHPNVIRAVLLDKPDRASATRAQETIIVLETQVDDSTGESLGFVMERLFEAGALDVYYTPVTMKKNRPGVLLTVLCHPKHSLRCEDVLLLDTTTFGVRRAEMSRSILERRWVNVDTKYGSLKVKQAYDGDRLVKASPEYEDAAQAARKHGVSLQDIYSEIARSLPQVD